MVHLQKCGMWPSTQEEELRNESEIPPPHRNQTKSPKNPARSAFPSSPCRAAGCALCVSMKPTSWSGSRASGSAHSSGVWTEPFCSSSGEWMWNIWAHARTHSAAQLTLLTSALSQVPLKLEASAGRNRHEWSFMNIWPSLNSSLRSLKLSSISGGTNFISSKFLTHFDWFPFGKGAFLLLPTKHPSSIASSRDSCRKTWPFCY